MKFSKLVSAIAVAAMLTAPVAAQAGTRASTSAVFSANTYSANRASKDVDADNLLVGLALAAVVIAGSVAVAVVVAEIAKTPGD